MTSFGGKIQIHIKKMRIFEFSRLKWTFQCGLFFEWVSNTVFKDILVPHFKKQFSSYSVSFCLFLILFFHSTRALGNWKKSRVSTNMAYSATSTVPLLFSSAALVASIAAFATSSLNDFKVPWEASGTENTTKN